MGRGRRCSSASRLLEGHRDNAAAALLGGLAICAPGAPAVQMAVSDELRAVLFIPDLPFATDEVAPGGPGLVQPGRRDLQRRPRCALLVRALALGDHAALRVAMQDHWHQDARFALMPGDRARSSPARRRRRRVGRCACGGGTVGDRSDPARTGTHCRRDGAPRRRARRECRDSMVLPPRNYGTRVDVST